jgi:hypothetical protein
MKRERDDKQGPLVKFAAQLRAAATQRQVRAVWKVGIIK